MPGSPAHLFRRFFDVLLTTPLDPADEDWIRAQLGEEMSILFFEQNHADRRHGLDAARFVERRTPDAGDLIKASLMHDAGKRHSHLGVFRRVTASIAIKTGLPLKSAAADYRDHGPIAAAELEAVGAPSLAVEFARSHHGSRPDTIDQATWQLLVTADQPAKALDSVRRWITSKRT